MSNQRQAINRAIREMRYVSELTASSVADHAARILGVQPDGMLREIAAARLAEMFGLRPMRRRRRAMMPGP